MAGRGFYERAMEAAEALDFAAAKELVDVQDEIAIARLQVAALREVEGGDPEVLLKAIELVGKLAAIQFRISSRPSAGLSESLAQVMRSLGELASGAGT